MRVIKSSFILLLLLLAGIPFTAAQAQDYYMYVALESEDEVAMIHFNAQNEKVEVAETIPVGSWPTENEGPHGMTVSPDGDHWFVSIAHGNPYGRLWKFTTGDNKLVGQTELGMFPASMEISEKTGLLYVVNFNLHGDMEPSTVSVVDPKTMTRIADIPTGIMPHGSRMTEDGSYQYHVSMMTDELIEINTAAMEVSRRLNVSKNGKNKAMHANHGNKQHAGNGQGMAMAAPECKPTWAHPHPDKKLVYVACNGADNIAVVDTKAWEVVDRFQTGKAPYNLEVSPDGKMLVVSYKGEGATGIWNLEEGKEVAKIENSRKVTHGVAISPDSRYAFVTVEGIGGQPGSVEVFDLKKLEGVDYVETGKQAGGIYFWKMEK